MELQMQKNLTLDLNNNYDCSISGYYYCRKMTFLRIRQMVKCNYSL